MLDQIDVIFPTRNRLKDSLITIQKMLDCGINEEQITIGDDGSDNNLALEISKSFPSVTIIRNNDSIGQLATRNKLFAKTARPYILSLDDDSHILSSFDLKEAIAILENDQGAGIFGFQAHQEMSLPPKKYTCKSNIEYVRTFIACGALIKRSCITKIGGQYTREELGYYCEELDCSIRAFKKGLKVITKKDLWVHHRVDRNYKTMPKESDTSKGIFGSDWRSMMGFSDNMIITGIYYPYLIDIFFVFLYPIKRFVNFTVKNRDFKAYFMGIRRSVSYVPYTLKNKSPLSYKQFIEWIRLPMM